MMVMRMQGFTLTRASGSHERKTGSAFSTAKLLQREIYFLLSIDNSICINVCKCDTNADYETNTKIIQNYTTAIFIVFKS